MSQKIYIIHGWSYNLDKWQALLPLLKKQNIEPVMLKVPGLTTQTTKTYNIDDYISWLGEELSSDPEPIVVGHSNGGRIALAYSQKYPGRFKHLILIDSAGLAHGEFVHLVKLKILYILSKIGKPFSKISGLRKIFYKIIGAHDYYQAPTNMRETMHNMLLADKSINLAQIKLPITIIWGQDDTITPLKDGQKMHDLLRGSNLHIIKGARHAPQDTNPGEVADIISGVVKE